jgi:hypothetical protein
MLRTWTAVAGLALLFLAGCDDAGDPAREPPVEPAEQSSTTPPEGSSGERAREALGEASDAARQTLESLGEAGQAGIEALQENAPEIREGLENAGERIRKAGDALLNDSDSAPVDAQGDSEADANETPESQEAPQ